ncbi:MAG: hypothetical protein QOK16_1570, partial [Solirubrobacteraceae bacterium]|nr:hypothetical protein [Solirubrobacteraceae bacterium]
MPDHTLVAGMRGRARALERAGRSPLCVELMRGAAANAESGRIVATTFDGDRQLPGSVPELRLLSALHHLVLSGHAPQLADHYPSVGGSAPPAGAWAAAEHALADDADLVAARLDRTVQTNEPDRCVSLFGGLLWLAERHRMLLLEVGARAGLNLNADRYRSVVGGAALGDPACELAFAPRRSRSPGSCSNPVPTALSCAVERHRSETATADDRRVPRSAGALERRAGVGGPPPRARRRARDARRRRLPRSEAQPATPGQVTLLLTLSTMPLPLPLLASSPSGSSGRPAFLRSFCAISLIS